MNLLVRLQSALMLLALAAYVGNGAQSHLQITTGDTLSIPICSMNGNRTVHVTIGGGEAEETPESCCGDCSLPFAISANLQQHSIVDLINSKILHQRTQYSTRHRTPLWPGAPPQGPPTALKA